MDKIFSKISVNIFKIETADDASTSFEFYTFFSRFYASFVLVY